jgi:hypothetical protein
LKPGPIHRLLYVSRISVQAAGPLASTMEDLLLVSHSRNARLGVTGFLWADGVLFTQVLEGPGAAIDRIFASIRRDNRHTGIRLALGETIETPTFDRWSMCGMTLSDLDERLIGEAPADLFAASADDILAMLGHLAKQHGPHLDAQHERLVSVTAR